MMKRLLFAIAGLFAMVSMASADTLIGSTVTLTIDYLTLGTAVSIPDTETVGAGIEFPTGSLQPTSAVHLITFNGDVGASSIDLQYTESFGATPGAFNGYVFDFDSASPVISSVALDPLSTFSSSDIGLGFSDHEVTVNVQGLDFSPASRILIDLNAGSASSSGPTAAPEPQAFVLMLTGLVLVSPWLIRRKKAAKRLAM